MKSWRCTRNQKWIIFTDFCTDCIVFQAHFILDCFLPFFHATNFALCVCVSVILTQVKLINIQIVQIFMQAQQLLISKHVNILTILFRPVSLHRSSLFILLSLFFTGISKIWISIWFLVTFGFAFHSSKTLCPVWRFGHAVIHLAYLDSLILFRIFGWLWTWQFSWYFIRFWIVPSRFTWDFWSYEGRHHVSEWKEELTNKVPSIRWIVV